MSELNDRVFKLLHDLQRGSGGDGDASLVHEYYEKLAADFERWAQENHPGYYVRCNQEGIIIFSSTIDQENIFFCESLDDLPSWAENILAYPLMDY